MSKSKNKKEFNPEEVLEDINNILDILNTFENTPFDKTENIIKDLNISAEKLEKKYLKKDLDIEK